MNAAKQSYALAFGLFALACHAWAMDAVDHRPIEEFKAALKASGQVRIAQGAQDIIAKDVNTGEIFTAKSLLFISSNAQKTEWTLSIVHDKLSASTVFIGTELQRLTANEPLALSTFDRAAAEAIKAKIKDSGAAYYPEEAARLKQAGLRRAFTGKVSFSLNSAFAMGAAWRQHQIDSNIVKVNIDGEDIQIQQGALRKIMADRVAKLKQQREALEASHGDTNEITRIANLIQSYAGSAADPATPDFTALKPIFADVFINDKTGQFAVLAVDQCGTCVTIATGDSFGDNPLNSK